MIKKILYTLLTVMLVSCALYGPTYTKPKVNTPEKWKSADKLSHVDTTGLSTMPWWEQFNDPELSNLMANTLKNNNNIQMAVGNVLAAKGQLEQVELSILPTANALFGHTNVDANMLVPGYNLGFVPNYSLNLFQYIRSKEFAEASVASATAAKDAVRLAVIGQTVGGYFSYLGQSYLLEQQKQLVTDLKYLLFLSQIQYEKGLISLYTLQQYEQQYDQAKAEIPIIQNNIVVSQNALRLLENKNPGKIPLDVRFMNLKSNNLIPINLPSEVLKNRPDVREAEQDLIAANADIGVATSTFFPTISLTGVLGSSSNALGNLFSSGSDFWSNEEGITMPVLSPGTFGQIKQAKGQYYASYYNYIQTVRGAFRSVDNDLSAHDRYYDSFMTQTENYASSKKAYDLAKISYEKGLYSYPTVLTNKVNLDNAAIALTQSKLAQLNTIVQLYQDLAAGYAYENH